MIFLHIVKRYKGFYFSSSQKKFEKKRNKKSVLNKFKARKIQSGETVEGLQKIND